MREKWRPMLFHGRGGQYGQHEQPMMLLAKLPGSQLTEQVHWCSMHGCVLLRYFV